MAINGIGNEFMIRIAGSKKKTVKQVSKDIAGLLGMKKAAKVKKANPWDSCILYRKKRFSFETPATFTSEDEKKVFRNIILGKIKGDATISFTPISTVTKKLNEIV